MPYAELSEDGSKIVTLYAGPQQAGDKGGAVFAIANDDSRLDAFTNAQAAPSHFAAAVGTGVAIVSAGTPALSGTYGISPQDEINLTGLQAGIAAGAAWIGFYRDTAGVKHLMTAAQFTTLATAILGYIEALDEAYAAAAGGGAWVARPQPVTIA